LLHNSFTPQNNQRSEQSAENDIYAGPWGIEVAADGMNMWVGCPRYTVATVAQLPNQVRIGEADANAALIAAAPELLAALRELVSQVEGFQDCNGDKGFVLSDALAAIAKAGGAA